jgi:ribosomal protein L24
MVLDNAIVSGAHGPVVAITAQRKRVLVNGCFLVRHDQRQSREVILCLRSGYEGNRISRNASPS